VKTGLPLPKVVEAVLELSGGFSMPGDCDANNGAWTAGYKAESVVRGSQGKAF